MSHARVVLCLAALIFVLGAWPAAAGAAPVSPEPGCEEILIPLPDGTRLHGWVRHGEDADGPRPVLWTMTPYTNIGCPAPDGIFSRGIADRMSWVRLSYRGTGGSEGIHDAWGPGELQDTRDIADWLAAQPWADGLVPTGASAEGAWITYAVAHPAVEAAVWITSCADGYRGCVRSGGSLAGGAFALTAGELAGYLTGVDARIRNGTVDPTPAEQLAGVAVNAAPAFIEDNQGPFWRSRLGLQHLRGVQAPVMLTTDLYDFVPHGMYLAYEALPDRNAWLNLGIGHNDPDPDQGSNFYDLVQRPIREFVRRFALDRKGAKPPQRVRVVTNLGTLSGYKQGEVLVRSEPDWPLPSTRWTRLYLDSDRSDSAGSLNDGSLTLSAPSGQQATVAPMATVSGPHAELRTSLSVIGAVGQPLRESLTSAVFDDLGPHEAIGLTYTTPPLARDTELTGPLVLTVRAISTAPNFDWQVRLTDVHPDGQSSWISDGQLRASLRRVDWKRTKRNQRGDVIRPWLSYREHEPVPIGIPVEYLFELAPTSNVFRRGHRIRLDIQPIASSYIDSARSGGVGAIEVLSGGAEASRLLVPVIPGRCQKGRPAAAGIDRPRCGSRLTFAG